jgi:CcmD family protein
VGFLIGAYVVIWLLVFVFVGAIAMRQRRLERQIEGLEEMLAATDRRRDEGSL